ncbi:ABC transporter permease [Roseomonas sp. 18066]|uniref:ABC transporter permease n=1 Tax=Roseomonas sp. 18066 TaxID=2681412 RepID=UPI001359F1F8|nr:ABC transporter permease [Roseomonas sp. 18066]
MSGGLGYALRRLWQGALTMLLIVVFNFFLLRLAPGDIVDVMIGQAGGGSPEAMAAMRQQFGLDQGALVQFLRYIGNLLQFDLGYSFSNSAPVTELILGRLPASALLMVTTLVVAGLAGTLLGTLGAVWRGRLVDRIASAFSMIGFAVPVFWLALMLVVVFAVQLRWLPANGMVNLLSEATGWRRALDIARHMILPVTSLAFYYTAIYARLSRAALLDVAKADYVRTARSKGLGATRIVLRHQLRNALLPLVTMTGLQLGALFSGSVVIESIFAWPGLGRLAFDAVFARDLTLLLGILFFSSLLVVVMNLLTDFLYAFLDPRIELA